MSDLISRQAAIDAVQFGITYAKAINKDTGEVKEMFENENKELKKAIERIEQLPSAQPEIIRCKECLMHGVCRFEQGLGLDGYCSKAERRTDEKT